MNNNQTISTGIACTKDKVKISDHSKADTIWFTIEKMRVDANSKTELTDEQVVAKCEAIARKLNFQSDVIRSSKVEGCLVAFREGAKSSSEIDDIAIPELDLAYLNA